MGEALIVKLRVSLDDGVVNPGVRAGRRFLGAGGDDVGEGRIDIKVVVHGKAIEYFMAAAEDEGKQMTLDSLRLRDVQFIICGNSLDGYKVTHEDLYEVEEEDVVQAGLPTIIDLQQKGYIYVRP